MFHRLTSLTMTIFRTGRGNQLHKSCIGPINWVMTNPTDWSGSEVESKLISGLNPQLLMENRKMALKISAIIE